MCRSTIAAEHTRRVCLASFYGDYMLKRRLILACSLVAASGVSMAQTYPNKLIKLQVPFAPGAVEASTAVARFAPSQSAEL